MNSLQDLNAWGNTAVNFNDEANYVLLLSNAGNVNTTVQEESVYTPAKRINITSLIEPITDIVVGFNISDGNAIIDFNYIGTDTSFIFVKTSNTSWTVNGIRSIAQYNELWSNLQITTSVDYFGNFDFSVTVTDFRNVSQSYIESVTVLDTVEFVFPSSLNFDENKPVAIGSGSGPLYIGVADTAERVVTTEYTVTIEVIPGNPGNIALVDGVLGILGPANVTIQNSFTFTGTKTQINSILNSGPNPNIFFAPEQSNENGSRIRYTQTRSFDGLTLTAECPMVLENFSNPEFRLPSTLPRALPRGREDGLVLIDDPGTSTEVLYEITDIAWGFSGDPANPIQNIGGNLPVPEYIVTISVPPVFPPSTNDQLAGTFTIGNPGDPGYQTGLTTVQWTGTASQINNRGAGTNRTAPLYFVPNEQTFGLIDITFQQTFVSPYQTGNIDQGSGTQTIRILEELDFTIDNNILWGAVDSEITVPRLTIVDTSGATNYTASLAAQPPGDPAAKILYQNNLVNGVALSGTKFQVQNAFNNLKIIPEQAGAEVVFTLRATPVNPPALSTESARLSSNGDIWLHTFTSESLDSTNPRSLFRFKQLIGQFGNTEDLFQDGDLLVSGRGRIVLRDIIRSISFANYGPNPETAFIEPSFRSAVVLGSQVYPQFSSLAIIDGANTNPNATYTLYMKANNSQVSPSWSQWVTGDTSNVQEQLSNMDWYINGERIPLVNNTFNGILKLTGTRAQINAILSFRSLSVGFQATPHSILWYRLEGATGGTKEDWMHIDYGTVANSWPAIPAYI